MRNQLDCLDQLDINGKNYGFYSLKKLEGRHPAIGKLPYSLKILLENLARHEDGSNITADDVAALANWDATAEPDKEISFTPARVVLQDFTGVPAIVDLAAGQAPGEQLLLLGGDEVFESRGTDRGSQHQTRPYGQ